MILHVHRKPFRLGIERRALGNRPREQYAVVLEAEVVVEMARQVFLDAEEPLARFLLTELACRFRRFREVAFAFVFFESHGIR